MLTLGRGSSARLPQFSFGRDLDGCVLTLPNALVSNLELQGCSLEGTVVVRIETALGQHLA